MCKTNYKITDLNSVTWINIPRDTVFSTEKSYNELLNYLDQQQVVYWCSFF